jgi:MFS superfamily sulfate permease-like transporter
MKNESSGFLANIKYDLPASIVVFLVAVPLCLGIALASGAPPLSGIIAGIVGGIIVSTFSGSPLGVSGPAAGLAAIVLTAIPALGGFEIFLLAVVIAGVIQFLLGVAQAGIIGYYFPTSVIKGMLAGIGVIIFLKQIPHAFGYDKDPEGDLAFQQIDGQNTFSEIFNMMDFITPGAIIIASVSLLILILWERPFIKKLAIAQWVQGPLVAVVTGIVLGSVFASNPDLVLGQEHLVSLPIVDGFKGIGDLLVFPDFTQLTNPQVYVTAVTLAVVASLETLLCVEATDKLDPQKRVTPTNQELRAQGIGNFVSGMIGGLPVTQVIVRSSANIQSGGRTKVSAFLHGILILLTVLLIPTVLNMIPLATLAAILLMVGYKLAKPSLFREMYKKGKFEFIPFIVTILGIVFTDLLTGIGLGMAVAVVFILMRNYQIPFIFDGDKYSPGDLIVLELSEHVTFLNKAGIQKSLQQLPDHSTVRIDGSGTLDIHPDVLEIIEDFKTTAVARHITVETIGLEDFIDETPLSRFERAVVPQSKKKSSRKINFKNILS